MILQNEGRGNESRMYPVVKVLGASPPKYDTANWEVQGTKVDESV